MSQSTESTTESNPFTKPGFIIAAALVVALIAAAVVIFLLPKGQDTAQVAPAASPDSTTAAAPTKSADAAGKSVCGLPSSTETALGTAPKSKWELVGKIAAPTDPKTFGPGMTDEDGLRSCFAKSPTGALYAAANILAMGSSGDPVLSQKATDKLLMPGPGRDIARADSSSKPTSNSTVQFRGFVIKSYSPTAANVDIAFQTDKGMLGHAVLPLLWADGDWKLAIADSGQLINEIAQIRDLSGFIAWSGA
ncbi:hypothetical protein QK292_15955 [Arthrobacter sp. AL08]|uniref:hypothetical protein n=1 Tax=unclassified Arthrobacter TaxID=235627 RepID=UPI00249B35F7|nr:MULTISPECIES: hypothetical protein [unclassified Arthrobacter]MDI3243051.1 hypothetical protein [Arthrobacter sp. AL05]MDI3279061.1 hypothetical protein [Arthrobacter sp. AL08]